MNNSYPVSTPLAVNHSLFLAQYPTNMNNKNSYYKYAREIHYLSLIGSFFFAVQTCPDIQYTVGLVAQFAGNPGIAHLASTKCILCYLKGTSDYTLVLEQKMTNQLVLLVGVMLIGPRIWILGNL